MALPVSCMQSHASRRPPDVILRTSFTRPSTALGDRRPGNEASFCILQAIKNRSRGRPGNEASTREHWVLMTRMRNKVRPVGHMPITVNDVGKKEKARHTWFWYGFEKKNEVLNDKEPYVG